MREITRETVCAVIVSKDKKVLFGRKDKNGGGVYSDCWHSPGGGIDEGETLEEALRRETREEVGINLDDTIFALLDDKGKGSSKKRLASGEEVLCHMTFNVYLVRHNKNSAEIKVMLSDDLVEYGWFDQDEMKELKLVPAGVELFREYGWKIFG